MLPIKLIVIFSKVPKEFIPFTVYFFQIITKDNILTTKFNATIQTVVIAHGYGVSPSYNQPMKDEILNTVR